jgi:hypothetical protein
MLEGLNRHMRAIIRMAEIRGVLARCIQKRELVTYKEVAECVGADPSSGFVHDLAAVARDDFQNGRPISTAIVVGKHGCPGGGFFSHAATLGAGGDADVDFWRDTLVRLGYDPENPSVTEGIGYLNGAGEEEDEEESEEGEDEDNEDTGW